MWLLCILNVIILCIIFCWWQAHNWCNAIGKQLLRGTIYYFRMSHFAFTQQYLFNIAFPYSLGWLFLYIFMAILKILENNKHLFVFLVIYTVDVRKLCVYKEKGWFTSWWYKHLFESIKIQFFSKFHFCIVTVLLMSIYLTSLNYFAYHFKN